MRRVADAKEIGCGQRGASDQPSIHVRLREQFGGIGRFDATAVKQSGQPGNHNIFFFQLATNEGVYLLCQLRGGGAAGADGPDRLIGDHRGIKGGDTVERQYGLQLASDDRLGLPASRCSSVSPTQKIGVRPPARAAANLRATSSSLSPW
jgi:hypothetical protein